MNLRKTTVNGLKWTSLRTILQSVFQLVQIAVLARILPREAFGLVALTLMVVNFTTLFMDMGLNAAILNRKEPTREEYSSLYFLSIAVSLVVYVVLVFTGPLIAGFYQEDELLRLIPLLGLNVILMAIGRQHNTVLQKEFQFESIAVISLISVAAGLVVAVVTALLGWGVYSLVFSTLSVSLISNVWMMHRNTKKHPLMFRIRKKELMPFLKVGGYNMGSNLMDFFFRESDTLIIGKIMGADTLGLYTLAKQLVIKIYNILNPILMNVLNPVLSSIQSDKHRVKELVLKAVALVSLVAWPVYVLVAILSFPLLLILYGHDYTSGWLVLSAMAVTYLIQSVFTPSGSLQIATGRTDTGFYWTVVQAVCTPLLILITAPFGINAVAIGVAILNILFIVPHWWMQYHWMAGIRFSEYLHALNYPFRMLVDKDTPGKIYSKVSAAIYELLRRRSVRKSRSLRVDDYRTIPIVINNRNRLTFLRQLIEALEKRAYSNIIILDNQSSWPPLLDYYRQINHRVVYLNANLGYNALEKIPLYRELRKGYFVYTDSDIVPAEHCPDDFLLRFLRLLQEHDEIQKVGFSLKIDDLPDHFADKQKIISWEKDYFESSFNDEAYEAPIDTTFALHRPYALISTVGGYRMLRTAAPLEAKHMPWYNDSSQLSDEELFYLDHVEVGTHWSKGLSIQRLSLWRRIGKLICYV